MILPVRHRIQRERMLALQVIVSRGFPTLVPFPLETIAEIEQAERSAREAHTKARCKAARSSRRAA